MARCNLMPERYVLTQSGTGNGTYITTNNPTNNFYSYYLENGANNALHITFGETGEGRSNQRSMTSMHITQTLPGTGFNIRHYFDILGNVGAHNASGLPLNRQAEGRTLMHNSLGMYRQMAREICRLLV